MHVRQVSQRTKRSGPDATTVARPRPALALLIAAAASLPIALSSSLLSPVRAEEPEEMLIGTFKLRSAAPPAAPIASGHATTVSTEPMPAVDEQPASPAPSRQTAADQLGAALGLFAAGDRIGGQRALEVLVASWPHSPEASHARKALADLYRQSSASPPAAAQPAPLGGTAPHAPAPPAERKPDPSQSTPAAASAAETLIDHGWTAEVRRDNGLDRRFILEAGDRVFFGEDSSELGARARTVLAAQARWLDERPDVFAIVEGHADEKGSDAANLDLSRKRAEAVRNRLIEEGVGPERLKAVGLGRNQRLAQCEEPECAAQNRRVVTAIFTRDGTGPAPPASPLSALPPPALAHRDASATLLATVAPALRPRR